MKNYLSLIPISAKVRKHSHRMTVLCIIISVLLVTTIFSISDMVIRSEGRTLQAKHGNWHIGIENLSEGTAEEISRRPDVLAVGRAEKFNTDAEDPYYIGKTKAALYGTDQNYLTEMVTAIEEGEYPQEDNEVVLSSNAKVILNVKIGDHVELQTPAGNKEVIISGFGSDDKQTYDGQYFLIGVYMRYGAFASLMEANGVSCSPVWYVQFQNAGEAVGAIAELSEDYRIQADSISENTALMAMAGKSSSNSVKSVYGIAGFLFVLVLIAGGLMISGSMNSNVAQRTRFFGMMRCIGASRSQVIRYVRLEALNWCKKAVPIGLVAGTVISWCICAVLHYGIGGEFKDLPVFAFSPVGLLSGAAVGVITVLIAAQLPARRAAKVSPVSAISGNMDQGRTEHRKMRLKFGKIEKALGMHHAIGSKKAWFLMTASFSLSIILVFSFSVGLQFAKALLPAMRDWKPDLLLNGYANERILSPGLCDEIQAIPGVKQVYGCAYMASVPAISSREGVQQVNLVSYSSFLMDCAEDVVTQGDIAGVVGDNLQVMTAVNEKENPLRVGDTVEINGTTVEITGAVSEGVYPTENSVICSPETYERLTGEQNYSLIGIILDKDATNDTIQQIYALVGDNVIFSDLRESNSQDRMTYTATVFVVYSFLLIIAIITVFNIINSISMSVTARMKQYGIMRAVGMDSRQVMRMIASEAFTYAISGLVIGGGLGILLNHYLYVSLVTRYFGNVWHMPVVLCILVVIFTLGAAVLAFCVPAKRIQNMVITENIQSM